MSIPDLLREHERGPLGLKCAWSSASKLQLPKLTPGPLGTNDAFSLSLTYRDLSAEHQKTIQRAIKFALRKIADAKKEIEAAKTKISPRTARYFKITGQSEKDIQLLNKILENYNIIAGALLGHEKLVFDGEQTGPAFNLGVLIGKKPLAYTWSNDRPAPGKEGVVKVVKPRFNQQSLETQARIIIHEVSHRYAGVEDKEYLSGGGVGKFDSETAVGNADTYAHFAIPEPRSESLKTEVK